MMKPIFHFMVSRVETRRFQATGQQTLKPIFHFTGARIETRRFGALWVRWIERLVQPPTRVRIRVEEPGVEQLLEVADDADA